MTKGCKGINTFSQLFSPKSEITLYICAKLWYNIHIFGKIDKELI